MSLSPHSVVEALDRIQGSIHHTPLMRSSLLDTWLGHEIIFKMDALQKVGAFKYRGVTNTLLSLLEQGERPRKVVAFSSGNHAQATAAVCQKLGIPAEVHMHRGSSPLKQAATRSYGATVVLSPTRREAEDNAAASAAESGAYLLHPYDNDLVIAGQGTSCLEALQDGAAPTAIFCTCSGGGWISGTYLATQHLQPGTPVFAGEPLQANDAARSYRSGEIFIFEDMPQTIADGATALCLKPRTFQYIRQLAGFYEVTEDDILYWTQWLISLLKINIEPTSAVAMAAAFQWLQTQTTRQRVLVMISGGNIAPETQARIWAQNRMELRPDQLALQRAA